MSFSHQHIPRLEKKHNLLLCLLQLSVQPAVLLLLDEQGDDVAFVEAEECVVVARRVGKDGPDPGLLAHVETR